MRVWILVTDAALERAHGFLGGDRLGSNDVGDFEIEGNILTVHVSSRDLCTNLCMTYRLLPVALSICSSRAVLADVDHQFIMLSWCRAVGCLKTRRIRLVGANKRNGNIKACKQQRYRMLIASENAEMKECAARRDEEPCLNSCRVELACVACTGDDVLAWGVGGVALRQRSRRKAAWQLDSQPVVKGSGSGCRCRRHHYFSGTCTLIRYW